MTAFVFGAGARVYVNGFDSSAYFSKAALKAQADTPETTCFGATAKTYVGGMADQSLSLDGFFDGSPLAADAELSQVLAGDHSIVVMLPGGDGFGHRGYGFDGILKTYEVNSDVSDAVKTSAEFQSATGQEPLIVAQPLAALTATTTGASIDGGAASANGLSAFLVVTDVSGTTPSVTAKVQHSTDNTTFADLVSFAAVTTPNHAQRVSVSGAVNRYVRALLTISGTTPSLKCWLGIRRK